MTWRFCRNFAGAGGTHSHFGIFRTIAKIEDVAKVGDIIPVKVKQIDDQGFYKPNRKKCYPKRITATFQQPLLN